jgi:hypothetical protein
MTQVTAEDCLRLSRCAEVMNLCNADDAVAHAEREHVLALQEQRAAISLLKTTRGGLQAASAMFEAVAQPYSAWWRRPFRPVEYDVSTTQARVDLRSAAVAFRKAERGLDNAHSNVERAAQDLQQARVTYQYWLRAAEQATMSLLARNLAAAAVGQSSFSGEHGSRVVSAASAVSAPPATCRLSPR